MESWNKLLSNVIEKLGGYVMSTPIVPVVPETPHMTIANTAVSGMGIGSIYQSQQPAVGISPRIGWSTRTASPGDMYYISTPSNSTYYVSTDPFYGSAPKKYIVLEDLNKASFVEEELLPKAMVKFAVKVDKEKMSSRVKAILVA